MNDAMLDKLRDQLDGPRDGSLLRFSLANALLAAGKADEAAAQCRAALDFDPTYSAAWKLLGKSLVEVDDSAGAATAWRRGIEVAAQQGDKQAEKEMTVFLRRLAKNPGNPA